MVTMLQSNDIARFSGHNEAMAKLSYRKAQTWEMDWAYHIFKTGMQSYITQTWGWNELFQEHSFFENIPASSFTIASLDSEDYGRVDIGGYCLKDKGEHLYLEMLLIDEAWQRQGLGSEIMTVLLDQALEQQLPIRLSVLKVNPAASFYQSLGFTIENEDDIRYRMIKPI